jgi:hypothetical protein
MAALPSMAPAASPRVADPAALAQLRQALDTARLGLAPPRAAVGVPPSRRAPGTPRRRPEPIAGLPTRPRLPVENVTSARFAPTNPERPAPARTSPARSAWSVLDGTRLAIPAPGGLHPLVKRGWPALRAQSAEAGITIPDFVDRAFEGFLTCGVPEAGLTRLRCPDCQLERALAFSCKSRGLCPSCGARRMHDVSEHLMERVFPEVPIRHYVLSPPSELVGLLAARENTWAAMARVFVHAIFRGQRARLGASVQSGAMVFVQRLRRRSPPTRTSTCSCSTEATQRTRTACWTSTATRARRRLRARRSRRAEGRRFGARRGYTGEAQGFSVHAEVSVAAHDAAGRVRLSRYTARRPLADAQLSKTRTRPTRRSGTSSLARGRARTKPEPQSLRRR